MHSIAIRKYTAPLTALLLGLVAACAPAASPPPIMPAATPVPSTPVVQPADLVLTGGRIVTVDSARPEAQAIAIAGDRIVAVGSNEEIQAYVGPSTQTINLEGRLAIPGFIEGHGHFMGLGRAKTILDLTTAQSWDDIVTMVAEAARTAKPGEWILGRGWHQSKWTQAPTPVVEGNPVHATLSRVSPNNPVYLTHASGHAAFANARAMELAGITRATRNPSGGEIVRDRSGNATGLLRETAQGLAGRALEAYEARRPAAEIQATMRRMAELAGAESLAKGITSFHDAGVPFETIDFYRRLADEGQLPVRLYVMVRGASNQVMAEKLPAYRVIGHGNNFLTVRSIKRQVDGALGAHGAWLLEPYTDLPRSTGLNLEPVPDIARTAELAVQHGYQLNVHAIGDRGNREILDLYQRVFQSNADKRDLRWRIEHAQHLHPADIPRFAQLGVIASMQGVHATSDGPWVPAKLGPRRTEEGAYVWQKLWSTGALVTNGTDVPVEDISPIASFYSSVSRRLPDGSIFLPGQRMTREQALRSYTINNAYAAFEEDLKGTLTPGKLADIVVLSRDIMTVPEEQIPGTQVVYTIVGGKVRYQQGSR
ncbi:MAG: amidohydrolase [Gemmatimonadetes bacterium]|nr:amidohydrolase [Gemmatimonadota bacterium]